MYDDSWTEVSRLGDGTKVRVRTIRPEDKEALRDGFERLSPQSKRMRFFGVKTELSDSDLRQLTEVDGVNHFAVVAARLQDDGTTGEGLGVARFLRCKDSAETAEAAVTVVDSAQSKGLGTLLSRHLFRAAAERGIKTFHAEFFTRNQRVAQVLQGLARNTRFTQEGEYIRAEIPIPDVGESVRREGGRRRFFRDLLGHSAREDIELRTKRLLLKIKD